MGDTYRPNRYRGRDYQESQDNNYRPRGPRRSRSRSPPRRLDYDGNDYVERHSQVYPQSKWSNESDRLRFKQDYIENPGKFASRPRGPPSSYGQPDNYAEPQEPVGPPPNHGQNDAAPDDKMPLKLVLVRGMKQTTSEELFAKGMEKLYKGLDDQEGGATPNSLRRVMLIRDRKTDQSAGYGFAEYYDIRDAQRVVEKAKYKEDFGQLTIASTKVNVCFPHTGVFPNDEADGKPEYNDKFKFKLFTDNYHKYYDRRYYASILYVNTTAYAIDGIRSYTETCADIIPNKTRSPYESTRGFKQVHDPDKKATTKKTKRTDGTLDGSSKKTKVLGSSELAIFSTWNNKQAELRGEEEAANLVAPVEPATGVNAIAPVSTASTSGTPTTSTTEQTFVYESDKGVVCWLCQRSLPNKEDVGRRHVQESKIHEENLKDEEKKDEAYEKMKAKNIDPNSTLKLRSAPQQAESMEVDAPAKQYRDRAAERRRREPSEPPVSSAQKVGFSLKKKDKDKSKGPASDRPSSSSGDESKKPTYGKGFNMLQKHGWSEGQGLGSEGLAAPIEQSVFASGVGLGHEESKKGDAVEEAERATREGGESYQDAVRRTMLERYQRM